jgi:hypothetical protein
VKRIFLFALSVICFQLLGCASTEVSQIPAPIVAPATSAVIVAPVVVPEVSVAPVAPAPITPQPTNTAPVLTGNAIASLVAQARAQYAGKNYQACIATAERGLRIDRRAPELYLLLAQSYLQLANTPLANQFVQQGIRYAQAGSEVAQRLLKIKESLPH